MTAVVCTDGRHTDSLSPLLCRRFVRSLRWVPDQQTRWLDPQQQHAPSIHDVPTWAIRCIARYVLSWYVLHCLDAKPLATLQSHTLQCLYVSP